MKETSTGVLEAVKSTIAQEVCDWLAIGANDAGGVWFCNFSRIAVHEA